MRSPAPATRHSVEQGPCVLPGGRCVIGRGRTPPLRITSELAQARCGPSWTPAPTKFYRQTVRRGGALPRPAQKPPLPKGGRENGDADCHTSDIGHWFAMTVFFMSCGASPGGGVRAPRPTTTHFVGRGPCTPPGVRWKTDSGRPGGRPLRNSIGKRCVIGRGRTPPLRITSELVQARCGPSWTPTPTKFYR